MNGNVVHQSWLSRSAQKEAKRDRLGLGERAGQIIAIFFIVLFFVFFIEYQQSHKFFTSDFGTTEQILFYGTLLFGMVAPIIRLVTGRRNIGRLGEIANSILFIIAAIWFLNKFPFDFSQIASLFPEGTKFLVSWLTNGIVRILLILGIIFTVISLTWNSVMFILVRHELKRGAY